MKKALLIFAALMLMSAMVMAQDDMAASKIGFGLKAGINMGSASGDDIDAIEADGGEKGMRMGLGGGVFMRYAISPQFVFQPEVLYVMKGVKFEGDGAELEWKLDYIDVPILAKYTIATEGNIKPAIFAGPVVSMLLSAKQEGSGFPEEAELNGEYDVKDGFKSIDFGAAIGAGVDFKMASGSAFTFDVRYNLGLTNIGEDYVDEDETIEADVKLSGIMFTVGFLFR